MISSWNGIVAQGVKNYKRIHNVYIWMACLGARFRLHPFMQAGVAAAQHVPRDKIIDFRSS